MDWRGQDWKQSDKLGCCCHPSEQCGSGQDWDGDRGNEKDKTEGTLERQERQDLVIIWIVG